MDDSGFFFLSVSVILVATLFIWYTRNENSYTIHSGIGIDFRLGQIYTQTQILLLLYVGFWGNLLALQSFIHGKCILFSSNQIKSMKLLFLVKTISIIISHRL